MGKDAAYDEFVRARLPHLLRLGRALTLDDDAAAALVAEALAPVLAGWDSSSPFEAEDDVRRNMVRLTLKHHQQPSVSTDARGDRDDETWAALAAMSTQERILVALQLLEHLTDGQAADLVRCSEASARAVTQRALSPLDPARVQAALDKSVPADEGALLAVVRRDADRRRRRSTFLVGSTAVTVTLLAAAAITFVVVVGDDGPRGLPDKAYALAASPDRVWAVTDDPDCDTCSRLWSGDGTDEGWEHLHTFDQPPPTAELLMAPDGENGWTWFGRDYLQATHDGGDTWVIPGIDLRDSSVDVAVAGTGAWVLLQAGDEVHLWSSEVGSDTWEETAAPSSPVGRLRLAPWGDDLWLTHFYRGEVDLRPVPSSDGERTLLPCGVVDFPPRPPPGGAPGALWLTCADGAPGILVKRSLDGGVTWADVGRSVFSAADSVPISDETTLLRTFDGVRLIGDDGPVEVPLELRGGEVVDDGVFVDSEVGFLLTSAGRVLRSDDGGRSWSEIG